MCADLKKCALFLEVRAQSVCKVRLVCTVSNDRRIFAPTVHQINHLCGLAHCGYSRRYKEYIICIF